MKEIALDVRKLIKDEETNDVISGELVAKTKLIGTFEKIDNKFELALSEKSPFTIEELNILAKQIQYIDNAEIPELIKYLIVLKEWKKKIPVYLRRGWKYFYLLSGIKDGKKVVITFATRKCDLFNANEYLVKNCEENSISDYSGKRLIITNPEEIDKEHIFYL